VILELGVIAATVALAVGARSAERLRRHNALKTFEEYARSRSLVFVPPPSRPRGSSPRVEGVRDGATFAFDLYRAGSDVRTRVSAKVTKGVAPKMTILQRGVFTRTLAGSGSGLGHAAFDRAYSITGATTEEYGRLLEVVVPTLLLLDHREGVALVSTPDKVTLSWSGVERNPVLYDAARDAALAVASWHRPDTPYR
jgi:hypothetical protein